MVYWNRFISYIFRYHEYDKCENTGFAKVQKQNEKGKMQVNFKDQVKKEGLYSVYLYRETLADPDEKTFSQTDEETEKRVTAAEVLETMKEDGRAAELMANREKLPLLPNCPDGENGVIECVKINPNDIGLLNMDNWRLGVNSFLTHGFYSYKYLMLGRVLFDEEDTNGYILGVPGEYSSKEKYLAGIFGFDRFIPVKETRIKTGSFGYWVVDLK